MQGRPNKLDKGSQRFRQQFGFQLGVTKVKPKKKPISIQQYPGLQVMTPGDFETYSASAQWINRFIGPSQDIAQAVNTIMRKTITNVPTAELNKASKAYLGAHMTRYRESVSALEIGDLTVGSFPGKEKFVFGEKGWEPIIIQGHKAGTRTTYFNSQVLEEKLKEGRMYDIVGVAEPPESFYPGENDGELTFEYLGMTKKELEQKEKEFERKLPGYMTPGEKTQLWNVTKDHMYTDDLWYDGTGGEGDAKGTLHLTIQGEDNIQFDEDGNIESAGSVLATPIMGQ